MDTIACSLVIRCTISEHRPVIVWVSPDCRLGVIDGNQRGSPGALLVGGEFPAVFWGTPRRPGFKGAPVLAA